MPHKHTMLAASGDGDDRDAILKLIEMTWTDVHQSRGQEWHFWIGLAGIAAGLLGFQSNPDWKLIAPILLAAGFLVALVASCIAWCHWELRCKKMAYIEQLENALKNIVCSAGQLLPYYEIYDDVQSKNKSNKKKRTLKDMFVVSGLIFAFYFTIMVGFLVALFIKKLVFLQRFPIEYMVVPLLAVYVVSYVIAFLRMDKKKTKYRTACQSKLTKKQPPLKITG